MRDDLLQWQVQFNCNIWSGKAVLAQTWRLFITFPLWSSRIINSLWLRAESWMFFLSSSNNKKMSTAPSTEGSEFINMHLKEKQSEHMRMNNPVLGINSRPHESQPWDLWQPQEFYFSKESNQDPFLKPWTKRTCLGLTPGVQTWIFNTSLCF